MVHNSAGSTRLVQLAVPSPLYSLFDYRWPFQRPPVAGLRVNVSFGRQRRVAIVMGEIAHTDVPEPKLKSVERVIDHEPIFPSDILHLLNWASAYYQHPLGEVLSAALPVALRTGGEAELAERERFLFVPADDLAEGRPAPVQRRILKALADAGADGLEAAQLSVLSPRWRSVIRTLCERQQVTRECTLAIPHNLASAEPPVLLDEQRAAVDAVTERLGHFHTMLLNGVTGSGKTEVYLRCIDAARERGYQTLVLVPEIALTPQLMRRFEQRLSGCLASLHSGMNDTERLQSWLLCREGHADVVVGTRSAVSVPLPRLGLIIVDEEHDTSLKQQDGFRYHARDVALVRARHQRCPVVLGSATPSFETLNNAASGRYQELQLTRRAGDAIQPALSLLDIRRRPLVEGLSDRLILAIRRHLDAGGQALVFINRRGFAPTLICNDCAAIADCQRCDAYMTVHRRQARLRCHHCGAERPMPAVCESCGSDALDHVGQGTERIAELLHREFPEVQIARIDRDSTRRKGSLAEQLDAATSGAARLLVGTQMLAKGHHFPALTLVGILDADRGLFGSDFRALEQMGQLVVQVAGRAGRESRAGEVLVQTRNPDNPMLKTLIAEGYLAFAQVALAERKLAGLPPYAYVALIRAEAVDARAAQHFLEQVANRLREEAEHSLFILGPAPAPMERLAGRYRAQLLLQCELRSHINTSLGKMTAWVNELQGARRTRWSIDVDPVDLF